MEVISWEHRKTPLVKKKTKLPSLLMQDCKNTADIQAKLKRFLPELWCLLSVMTTIQWMRLYFKIVLHILKKTSQSAQRWQQKGRKAEKKLPENDRKNQNKFSLKKSIKNPSNAPFLSIWRLSILSPQSESNRWPHPYHGCALPTELWGQTSILSATSL